jgi:hypothetical protein
MRMGKQKNIRGMRGTRSRSRKTKQKKNNNNSIIKPFPSSAV